MPRRLTSVLAGTTSQLSSGYQAANCLVNLVFANLIDLKWAEFINPKPNAAKRASIAVTKNGRPHIAPLTDSCIEELQKLPKADPASLIFKSYLTEKPFNHRYILNKACTEAGFEGRTFHWLRHGCGSALASAGVSQAQIMQVMAHRTLTASARYMHSNVEDRKSVVERVFR